MTFPSLIVNITCGGYTDSMSVSGVSSLVQLLVRRDSSLRPRCEMFDADEVIV